MPPPARSYHITPGSCCPPVPAAWRLNSSVRSGYTAWADGYGHGGTLDLSSHANICKWESFCGFSGPAGRLPNRLDFLSALPFWLRGRLKQRGMSFERAGNANSPGSNPVGRWGRLALPVGALGIWRGNMAKFGNAPLLTDDIISPWKKSWWKVAVGSWLPAGGCHALWLPKYFSAG